MEQDRVRLRSEAEAPWRSLRLTLFGFSVASAGMGTLISLPQLIGALGGAPGALTVETVLQNLAINLGAVGIFSFLFSRDWKVVDALAAAEPYKDQLIKRGVLVVPLPIYSSSSSSSGGAAGGGGGDAPLSGAAAAVVPALKPEELRWRVTAINPDSWRAWFDEQLALASKATSDRGLFVGLRLDGRTRSSGMGSPPWARYAVELAPLEGDDKWTGFFDGFDGRV